MEIIVGDCLKHMWGLPNGFYDLVFFDPPYNVGKDYGVYKDNLPIREYVSWMSRIVFEAKRISRRGVVVYVSGTLTELYFQFMTGAHLIPVHKRAAGVVSDNYMLQYHSILSTAIPVVKTRDLWDDIRLPGEGYFFNEPRFVHPGLTGLKLTKRVITTFTHEGDVVFDPFAGSGTTAIACMQTGRSFEGRELNPAYVDISKERIAEESMKVRLPGI